VLVECCEEVAARRKAANDPNTSMVGYEDIGEAAYGSFGRKLVSTTMYTELLGICALLFILEVRLSHSPHAPLLIMALIMDLSA